MQSAHHPRTSAGKECRDRARHERVCSSATARRSAYLESPPVSQWVRLLSRVTGASAEWHVPRIKSFTVTTYCGKELAGPLEVASDDKAERQGRCSSCVTHLPTTPGIVPQRASQPLAQKATSPVKKSESKMTAANSKTVRKPAPKGRSGKPSVARRPVRRPRRGEA